MDLLRAAAGVAVAVFMMVAPHLGVPYLESIPIVGQQEPSGPDGGPETLARMDIEVGTRVSYRTLDAGGDRGALRVLWVEVEGSKLEQAGQGQGKVQRVRFVVAAPGGLALGNDTLLLKPGDELAVEGFEGRWAYAPEGMVGLLRMEGAVLQARVGDKGLRPLGTQEQSVAPGWALSGEPRVANVTLRAGRTAFVSTEARAGDDVVKHVRARDVRINGARVQGTRWGEGPLDSVSFLALGPGLLKGDAGERRLQEGERVDILDFIGAYVVFHTSQEEARVALEGYAASVSIAAQAEAPGPGAGLNRAPVAGFDWSPAKPRSGEAVKFWDRSSDADGLVVHREWHFGDGSQSAEQNPSHAYEDDGLYQVTLLVTDNRMVVSSVTKNLTVLNTPPRAAWDANPLEPSSLDHVQFLDASSDGDGRIVAWQWDFGDGATSNEANPAHRFPDDGRFEVALHVWDDDGETATLSKPFVVRNLAPQARFSWLPAEPLSGSPVQFRDASLDQDGRIVAWQWDFGAGQRSTEQHPSFAFPTKGPSKVSLTATDDDGATHTWESVVDVRNRAPEADFRVTPDPPQEGTPSRFTDLSSDPDGRVVERVWSFGDGSISMQPEPTHTYLTGGNITASLTVKDDDGARSTAIKAFRVNRRPVAAFTSWPATPTTRDTVRFNDTSVDPDGAVASWRWSFGDGNASDERSPQHRYARAGSYVVLLEVTDREGAPGRLERALNVTNAPPLPDFAWEPARPSTNDDVGFRDASTDPDGAVRGWSWNFGDGTGAVGKLVSHRYRQAGGYPVTLVVTDDEGASATLVKVLQVNQAPVAAFTFAPAAPSVNGDVRFTDGSSDGDGQVVQWLWDFGDAAQSTERSPVHRFSAPGTYSVKLTVTDNDGGTAGLARSVVVGSLAPVAAFEAPARPVAGSPVQFTDASADPDGSIVAWRWDFGDGASSGEQHALHTYAEPNAYQVKLAVTDNAGKTASLQRLLRVYAAGPVEVALRVVYPDGQPFDLQRSQVQVLLRDQASNVLLEKGGPRPLQVGQGWLRGTLQAGEWAPGDPVEVAVRMPSVQLDQSRSFALPAGGDLGTMTLRMPLQGRVGLAPPMQPVEQPNTYTDPTEQVRGLVIVAWKDGQPVRGALVTVGFAWEQLGAYGQPVEHPSGASGESGPDGSLAFAVPFTAGLPDGPGSYLPGQYRVLARADYVVSDGLATWKGPLTFQMDPLGLRGLLQKR